jgi:hypothetical protein
MLLRLSRLAVRKAFGFPLAVSDKIRLCLILARHSLPNHNAVSGKPQAFRTAFGGKAANTLCPTDSLTVSESQPQKKQKRGLPFGEATLFNQGQLLEG